MLNQTKVASFINIEDMLFEVFQSEESNKIDKIALAQFVAALENTGLRRWQKNVELDRKYFNFYRSDPRLTQMLSKLKDFTSHEQQNVDRAQFKSLILDNIVLISRALRHQLIIPDFKGFSNIIELLFEESKKVEDGNVANYIPQLAK